MNREAISYLSQAANSMGGGASAAQRAEIASSVGTILDEDLSVQERLIALEIVEALANDKVDEVRRSVSEKVADSPFLPLAIARKLATDIASVALPVLELSPILTDDILIEVVESGIIETVEAVAKRSQVSAAVSGAIVETGHAGPITQLIRNNGAEISEGSFFKALENHGKLPEIGKAVIARGEVPARVLQAIETLVEAHIVAYVQRHFNLPEEVVRPAEQKSPPSKESLRILKSQKETPPKGTAVTW